MKKCLTSFSVLQFHICTPPDPCIGLTKYSPVQTASVACFQESRARKGVSELVALGLIGSMLLGVSLKRGPFEWVNDTTSDFLDPDCVGG